MIPALWAIITGNRIARALGIAVMAVLGVLTFGAVKKREGAQDQKAKHDAANAKADQQANERMNNADTGAGATDDERIDRLRDFAAKHSNRPAKAKSR